MTSDRPAHQFHPRPFLLPAEDFARLAQLAWGTDPRRSLSKQMHLALGVAEHTCERWLKGDQAPPPERIAEAIKLADATLEARATLLDQAAAIPEIAALLKAKAPE